jgi:hypothetical protein
VLLHRPHLACASAFVFCPIPADTDTPPASERTVVVLSNAPHLKARVAALVKGAEGRGFRLASSEVVRDTGGGDPVIVMVWEGKGVVKTMGKLNGAGQEEYVAITTLPLRWSPSPAPSMLLYCPLVRCLDPRLQAGAVHLHVTRQCAR